MTKKERQKFNELILEMGCLIDLINPGTSIGKSVQKNLFDISIEDVKGQIGFLRIFIKYILLDVEAGRRENASLLEIINHPGGQER